MIDLVAEQSPFGGLERWLHDPAVTEVMVNAGRDIWIEREGRLQHVGHIRTSTVLAVIEHVLAPTGRRLDRSHPSVDARLPDGSRLCAIIEPIAVDGPCVAIRRFAAHAIPLTEFASAHVVRMLEQLVRARCNVVVSGATSSGKTTLLNALAQLVEPTCRVITLEDVAELRLRHPHVVRLETREATPDGVGDVSLEHLLRVALRLRPDRLVVGEVRGAEAVHLLQALNTGHDGSLCTVHANNASDALARLATLVVQHADGWPLAAVHHHVARAVDAVVHVARSPAGDRRVVEVAEVASPDDTSSLLAVRPLVSGGLVVGALTRGRA
jgi:pilus assembly protein CpaF